MPTTPETVDAETLLRTLVGQPLTTANGRANRILRVEPPDVVVATDRSPDGKPVPIAWVQAALDRLRRDGAVLIHPSEIGYRSAFIGAVLRTLPGARITGSPPLLTIGSVLLDAAAATPDAGRPDRSRRGGSRDDYLRLSPSDARRQWEAIVARVPPESGKRQVDFAPVETLLCLAASLLVNHRRYGGSTAHLAEEPVPTLARLFRRPNSSVLAKMANLDGSRRNGARYEVEVAAELLARPDRLAGTYRLILAAARAAGIDQLALPDFLGLEDQDDDLVLLGQDELDLSAVEESVEDELSVWADQRSDLEEYVTQRLLVAVARVGQHRFAAEVLRNHDHRCVFCGLRGHVAGVRAARMLVASHIKPWKTCTPAERLDPLNGLTACPTHDVAFDTGLLGVNGGLRIHVAPPLAEESERDPAARAAFGRPPLGERLLLPAGAPAPRDEYLRWHRDNIYRGAKDA